jgi:hypothetical protein
VLPDGGDAEFQAVLVEQHAQLRGGDQIVAGMTLNILLSFAQFEREVIGERIVKSICDIMRRANCASALQYVPELTWILFLRILDAQEARDREAAEAVGQPFSPALRAPYRWQDWAAPVDTTGKALTPEGQPIGWKRRQLGVRVGDLFAFINKELLPYLHGLDLVRDGLEAGQPNLSASPKQRVIGRIMTAVEHVRVDSEDQPSVLHQGQENRTHLVLRPLKREGRQENPDDPRAFRLGNAI